MKHEKGQPQLVADADEIRRTLATLFEPSDVVEIRAFKNQRCTLSGYYDDPEKLAEDAVRVNQIAGAVYVTLNRIKPALLARRANRYEEFANTTTNDDQVIRRRWLPIDPDPGRPAGISATNTEHDAAIEKARQVHRFLVRQQGWPEPVAANSGNGGHLVFRIDLPNDDAARELVQKVLFALDAKFSGEKDPKGSLLDGEIGVDTSVYSAARIWKLYGTVAGKGDSVPDRPHRQARLLHVPDNLDVVPVEKLQLVAAMAPEVADSQRETSSHCPASRWIYRWGMPSQLLPGQGVARHPRHLRARLAR